MRRWLGTDAEGSAVGAGGMGAASSAGAAASPAPGRHRNHRQPRAAANRTGSARRTPDVAAVASSCCKRACSTSCGNGRFRADRSGASCSSCCSCCTSCRRGHNRKPVRPQPHNRKPVQPQPHNRKPVRQPHSQPHNPSCSRCCNRCCSSCTSGNGACGSSRGCGRADQPEFRSAVSCSSLTHTSCRREHNHSSARRHSRKPVQSPHSRSVRPLHSTLVRNPCRSHRSFRWQQLLQPQSFRPSMRSKSSKPKLWLHRPTLTTSAPKTMFHFIEQRLLFLNCG